MTDDDIVQLAPEHLRPFVIAAKHRLMRGWPRKYEQVLFDACARFNAGTHEMVQSYSGDWCLQYLIPRKRSTERRAFFDLGTGVWKQRAWHVEEDAAE